MTLKKKTGAAKNQDSDLKHELTVTLSNDTVSVKRNLEYETGEENLLDFTDDSTSRPESTTKKLKTGISLQASAESFSEKAIELSSESTTRVNQVQNVDATSNADIFTTVNKNLNCTYLHKQL